MRNLLLVAGMGAFATSAFSQTTGAPDPSWTVTEVQPLNYKSMALQPDGKVVAAGGDFFPKGFAVVRFNSNGSLDATFGTGGIVSTVTGETPDGSIARDVAVSQAGKIYAAGASSSGTGFAVVRYLGNGTPDPTFGVSGIARNTPAALVNFGSVDMPALIKKITIQSDEKLLVVFEGHETGVAAAIKSVAVVRLNPDGQVDQTFGTNGRTIIRLASNGSANAIRVSANRSIFIAGDEEEFAGGFIVKLTPEGLPDPTFGTGGKTVLQTSEKIHATSLAIQDDNKIVVAGRQWRDSNTIYDDGVLVLRLNANGSVDRGFGNGGHIFQDLALFTDSAMAIAIESSGKILVTGNRGEIRGGGTTLGDSFLLRLSQTGQPDTKFGAAGVVEVTRFNSSHLLLDEASAAYILTTDSTFQHLPVFPRLSSVRKFITRTSTAAPVVSITSGSTTLLDTDGVAGEIVKLSGTATDSDGTIASTQWLVDGSAVASGTSAALQLKDGANVVTFKAVDNEDTTTTISVAYTVQEPTVYLPRITSYSSQQAARASEFSIAIRNSTHALTGTSPVIESLSVIGYVFPQDADENFTADIYIVAVTPYGWFMRNLDGVFVPWNTIIASLVPAYENRQLTEPLSAGIFSGKLMLPGTYRFYVGYMRVDKTELIYTANAAAVEITP